MTPNLKNQYKEQVVPKLMEKQGYKNPMQVPALKKIVLTMCFIKSRSRYVARIGR